MKLINQSLLLLSSIVSTCLAAATDGLFNNINIDPKHPNAILCMTEITSYSECLQEMNNVSTNSTSSYCEKVESPKCSNFLASVEKDESQCVDVFPVGDLFIRTYRFMYYSLCVKDEDGKECPFQKKVNEMKQVNATEIIKNGEKTEEVRVAELAKSIEDGCYSTKCTDGTKIAIKKLDNISKYLQQKVFANENLGENIGENIENKIFEISGNNTQKYYDALENCQTNKKGGNATSGVTKQFLQWSGSWAFVLFTLFFLF